MVKFSGILFNPKMILNCYSGFNFKLSQKTFYIFLYKQYFLIECYLPAIYDMKQPFHIKQSYIIHYYALILGITFDASQPYYTPLHFYNIFFYNPQCSEDFFMHLF